VKGLLEELSYSLYVFITRGEYPKLFAELRYLVECGVARFMDGGSDITIEEPIALMSILRHFENKGVSLEGNIRMCMQSAQGPAFEEAVLLSCTALFRRGTRVDEVFRFHGKTPEWACQEATIYDIPKENPVTPSTNVIYSAPNPKAVEKWNKLMDTGWCVPGNNMGPDLMAWLRLKDGRMLLVVFQAKCRLTRNILTDVMADAIQSLIPGRFFSSLASIIVLPSALFPYHPLQKSASAKKEINDMLTAINKEDCFTGARYNMLRVIAAYSLDANLTTSSSKVRKALEEDNHPLATLRHAPLLASLTSCDSPRTILSSLSASLKRARCEVDDQGNVEEPVQKRGRNE
jgi:hypothetical protein